MFRSKPTPPPVPQPRRFNFIKGNNAGLGGNHQFKFAQKHALCHYPSGAIYSFIPKNACTTMRASLAVANGFLGEEDLAKQINWVHNNTYTFSATQQELIKAPYTFTILRDPLERLFSMFWDKFVDKTPVAWTFYRLNNNEIELDDLTFEQFVMTLKNKPQILRGDIHWRPQSDFLIYGKYDDYFRFEDFAKIKMAIEAKTGISIIDARPLTNHSRAKKYFMEENPHFANLSITELKAVKQNGETIRTAQMYNENLESLVRKLFHQDFLKIHALE